MNGEGHRRSASTRGETGFTLIEIVCAITILAVGVASTMASFNAMTQTHYIMKRRAEAILHGREMIAAIRMRALSPSTDEEALEGEFEDTGYRYKVVFSDSGVDNLSQVSVKIEWGKEEDPQSVFLYTLQYYG